MVRKWWGEKAKRPEMCLGEVGFAKLQMPRDADGRTDFTPARVFAIALVNELNHRSPPTHHILAYSDRDHGRREADSTSQWRLLRPVRLACQQPDTAGKARRRQPVRIHPRGGCRPQGEHSTPAPASSALHLIPCNHMSGVLGLSPLLPSPTALHFSTYYLIRYLPAHFAFTSPDAMGPGTRWFCHPFLGCSSLLTNTLLTPPAGPS